MSQDYKHLQQPRTPSAPGGLRHGLPYLLLGVVVGAGAVTLIHLRGPTATQAEATPQQRARPVETAPDTIQPPPAPAPAPAEVTAGQDYQFYYYLRNMEVPVVDWGPPRQPPTPTTPLPDNAEVDGTQTTPPAGPDGDYLLQIASLRALRDAEQLIQKLAGMGLIADIHTAELPGRGTWYRVQLGPFRDRMEAEAAKQRLLAMDMPPLLLRRHGEGTTTP